jgi:Protein of unknown function (DUF3747)
MKPSSIVQTTALLWGLSVALFSVAPSVQAATFDQKEIDPDKVIAVAVPLPQGNRYNFLILQQLSNTKQCWQENDGTVDPLLLKFDFTNICGRSTDSNGYSIRIAGQDKGMEYHFSIVKQNNHLSLMGIPSRNAGNPPIEIARSENLNSGFLKLRLNSGWHFAQRTYKGKTLGHIYLTRDTMPEGSGAMVASASPTQPLFRSSHNSGLSKRPPVKLGRNPNRASAYSSRAISINGPIEIPVPAPAAGYPQPNGPQPNGNFPVVAAGILPVPSANIPRGNAGNESDLITASTPSLDLNAMAPGASGSPTSGYQVAMASPNYRYRVFVNATDTKQRQAVKTVVPDAFRSSYQGRPMMQVGAFQDKSQADEVIARLSQHGIDTILATDSYAQ